jgi:hypothetical protein
LQIFLDQGNCREPSPEFFLSCTKNIELTRGGFALTVSFAHTKNKQHVPAAEAAFKDEQSQRHQPYLLDQHAMKSVEWKTYRTRFLVKAKQLSSNLSFTDHLGRQHCGRKGDYLVESYDGVLSIAPKQIFEDIYVPMHLSQDPSDPRNDEGDGQMQRNLCFEPLRIEKLKTSLRDDGYQSGTNMERMPRVRKSPQPVRVGTSKLSLM